MRKTDRHLAIGLAVLLTSGSSFGYVAIVNKTDHAEIRVVPAPGKVVLDGDLADWDTSGAILMCVDESSRESYSVRGAMMYDSDALYVGAHVKDPTPMVNAFAFGGDYGMSWNADAIQLRFLAEPGGASVATLQTGGHITPDLDSRINHITLWYSTADRKAGCYIVRTLGFKDPSLNPPGVAGAYKADPDGKGYAFEYRIPWSVLRAPRPFSAGDTAQVQWQLHWGNEQGTAVRLGMTDVRNAASGDLGYMGPSSWGTAIFEKSGNVKLAARTTVGRAEGHIPITFAMPKDGKASLAICNAEGKLVRTCFGAQPYPAGAQTYLWDGLDDVDRPVPAGTYTAKLLTHEGIRQKLVCDIGVSGTPPYQTEDGTGGWAGDYNAPLYVATDNDRVVLGTGNGEAAPTTIATDLDGRKLYGTTAAGGALTLHKGHGYFVQRGSGKLVRFDLATGRLAPFSGGKPEATILTRGAQESDADWGARSWQLKGVTTAGDRLVVSSLLDSKLLLVDPASGAVTTEVPLERPSGLAPAGADAVYAVSGNTVGRYDLQKRQFAALAKDLDEPQMLASDAAGNVYVSLQGKTMQVWKLAPDGKVLLKYGKAGGRPLVGKWDPSGLLKPYAIAVDANGRLWVAEADDMGRSYVECDPKRYSVWSPDGSLWKEFFGSISYSMRAYLDPARPEQVYINSVRYNVDYEKGTWAIDAIIMRPSEDNGVKFGCPGGHGGAVFATVKGRTFLWARGAEPGSVLYEAVQDRFVPRMTFDSPKKDNWWLDDNNDGRVQTEEIRADKVIPGMFCGHPMDRDLNVYWFKGVQWHSQGGTKTVEPYTLVRMAFLGFNEQGGLRYGDPLAPQAIGTDPDGGAVAACWPDDEGNVYALIAGGSLDRGVREQGSGHRVVAFSAQGKKLWEYQNVHCAFAWTSDAYKPGAVVGAFAFASGITPELLAVTGYYGQYFLLDSKEGLFVDALGEDQRSAYTLDQHMVLTENFNGTLFKHPKTGKTYFLGGDSDQRVWELAGMDTLQRKNLKVVVTADQVVQAGESAKLNFVAQQAAVGKKSMKVPRLKGAAADGKDDEWGAVQPLTICMEGRRTAQAQVGYDDANLLVRFQVSDESPFVNTPTDQRLLFKSGDSVEISLASDTAKRPVHGQNQQQMRVGDLRLILARTTEGKLVATRYRYVTAGPDKPNAFSVETKSSGKDTLDDVAAWNDLPMHATAEKDGYAVEVAIPWAELGVKPRSGLALSGDLGVIYGNEGGNKNAIRYMWSDKSSEVSINNDIPSEIRIHPNQWGSWMLE
jgi:DNA-binding beta-propeller fold protein YncE